MEQNIEDNKTATVTRWIRLPPARQVCVHSGLRRGQLFKLAKDPANGIKVCHLRERGAKRGTFLICLNSLLEFLDRRAKEGSAK